VWGLAQYQVTFNPKNEDIKSSEITFELKPYIQPFEKILARAELAGLAKIKNWKKPFESESDPFETISTAMPASFFYKRLAYWQRMGDSTLTPTLQILYEKTGVNGSSKNGGNENLHNRRVLRYGTHDLHEYRGKFFPQLVRSLINSSGLEQGDVVLDPMCGSGTTNCEAHSMGMITLGSDMNPLSVKIAHAKTNILDEDPSTIRERIDKITDRLKKDRSKKGTNLHERWDEVELHYLERWFDTNSIIDLDFILKHIEDENNQTIRDFLTICLSNIVRDVSWQKKEDLRVRKLITPYASGTAISLFIAEVERQLKKILPFIELVQKNIKVEKFEIIEGDARKIEEVFPSFVGKTAAIITSPPYATALPYLDTDRLSLIVLGLLSRKEHKVREYELIGNREISEKQRIGIWNHYQNHKDELPKKISKFLDILGEKYHQDSIGFRRKNLPALLSKYFLDMKDSMEGANKMLCPGGFAHYVVGNNSTLIEGEKLEIPTNDFLWEIGTSVGLKKVKSLEMELIASRDIFRENRGTSETLLIFKSH
jgi:site-specific DNA-methyltransferase (cytosine-N4-specific)